MEKKTGWFADIDSRNKEMGPFRWQPCLQFAAGLGASLDTWFDSETECMSFIRNDIIGKEMLDEDNAS